MKAKGTQWNAKRKIFQFQITHWNRQNFTTLKNKEWLAPGKYAKCFALHTTFVFVIREVAFKGRDKLGNEVNREFDYSMFHYRNDYV